ncbi:MAG: NIPSNAP family protein [Propionibacteriales bacterium]|nr:NIPSNAP family protein [Propionibacteriales bacterium]
MTVDQTHPCCAVVELRQYTLHAGQRDVLIDLFDREFVDPQETAGMHIVGQFRDLDDPNRFVWVRGFGGMPERRMALETFYEGPVWAAHRDTANATMQDSSNARLLEPVLLSDEYPRLSTPRRPSADPVNTDAVVHITSCELGAPPDERLGTFVGQVLAPALEATGPPPVAAFVTKAARNDYPQLPLRPGRVLVWVTRFGDLREQQDSQRAQEASSLWASVRIELERRTTHSPTVLRLSPTARSQLR